MASQKRYKIHKTRWYIEYCRFRKIRWNIDNMYRYDDLCIVNVDIVDIKVPIVYIDI